ncbi:class I SAM-dependent methyltransferase [Sinorhizobium meliloti]|uniref:class I SAM-dependent methyltransferase n=1 Tax=Rhizobium meliloti TaxID=382 RepID=UPI0002A59144|nr:class I SAM-dependent methyltransferase [Sinorhizobium meliloti]AGA11130.1 Methylase involved in ubiquinone/menaquinone biosynthesis [Sinorhizobium meliloti GR4]MQX44083.1 methyltransferase domain-containing protein [Sinorhizobium meliloti]RVL01823.1 class I SAM-dependent methyltransferase [Sinorhizobium meliloti]RVM93220.1 class I SAM-dependent methyltransferase [Sinorhizobium meliloti]RVN12661.1 class I SAM-dependent methyltransferase [Sinorhizobium meliloti]
MSDGGLHFSEEDKKSSEYIYWWRRWKSEKRKLLNSHYEYFYTEYFDVPKIFYEDKKVIDIGCGPRGSLEWVPDTTTAVGLDPLVDQYARFGISDHKAIYISSGAESIPVPTESFDCVFAFNSLDHVTNVDACIAEVRRILKPSGLFLFMVEINHQPTVQEPHTLSASVVEKFGFDVLDLRTYRQVDNAGCYDIVKDEKNRAVDDSVSDMWLTAKMRKKRYGVTGYPDAAVSSPDD